MPATIPVIVISLTRSIDRRAAIASLLNRLKVPFRFLDACDGADIDPAVADILASDRNRSLMLRKLSRGEIACALSHLDAARRIALSDATFTCLLEDDAAPDERLLPFLDHRALASLPRFDVLCLHKQRKYSRLLVPVGSLAQRDIVAPFMPGYLAHAQIYTREGAAKVAAHALPLGGGIDGVIYRDARIPGLRILEVRPGPVRADGESTICDRVPPPSSVGHFVWRKFFMLGRYGRTIHRFWTAWGIGGLLALRYRRASWKSVPR